MLMYPNKTTFIGEIGMKKLLLKSVLSVLLATTAMAGETCVDGYTQAIKKFDRSTFGRLTSNNHTVIHGVSAMALATTAIGPLGGYVAYPIVYNIIKADVRKMKFYQDLFYNQKDSNALGKILYRLQKKGINAEVDTVLNELNYLNESGALCDGSVFTAKRRKPGRNGGFRTVAVKVPSKSQLVRHLAKTLK